MRLTWRRARRMLKWPFQTAHGRRDYQETILMSLESDGVTGYGEGCASSLYGHTLESIEAALAQIAPRLEAARPMDYEPIIDKLLEDFDSQRAAVAAVDAALHDWAGKRMCLPTAYLLGVDPSAAPPTDMTIGIDDPGTIAAKVREAAAFAVLKVKVGVPDELEILETIRREGPDKRLRLDANCGWTAADAEARLRAVCRFNVELVEQPVRADDHATLRRLRELAVAPIVADESCVRPADVPRLAGVVDGINIKLNKCGGIREARRMIAIARDLGLRVMLGCTSESCVGVAAAAQLAALADWVDLDTHLLVREDAFTGLGGESGGRLRIGLAPGLGVWPRDGV